MSPPTSLTETEILLARRLRLKASKRRRAAAEILYLSRPALRLSRADIHSQALGLSSRFNAKTLDRATADLVAGGMLTLEDTGMTAATYTVQRSSLI